MANRKKIFAMTNGKCFYCGCKLDESNFHIDHVRPKIKGGNNKDNVVPACPECNLCKSDLTIEGFRRKIERYKNDTFYGKILSKYYYIEDEEVEFYFERETDGTIQNNIIRVLDGHESRR